MGRKQITDTLLPRPAGILATTKLKCCETIVHMQSLHNVHFQFTKLTSREGRPHRWQHNRNKHQAKTFYTVSGSQISSDLHNCPTLLNLQPEVLI